MSACEYTKGNHHSEDLTEVFAGDSRPFTICGFHAQPVNLAEVVTFVGEQRRQLVERVRAGALGVFYTGDLITSDESRMCLFCEQGTVESLRCDNGGCGHVFEDEAEVKQYTTETSVYGDPTDDGGGSVLTSGWVDPDWSTWTVYEEKPDTPADVMDEDDAEAWTAAQWLAHMLHDRLGSINPWDGGSTIYAADANTHAYEGKSITLAAHPEGFTPEEIAEASRLMTLEIRV